RLEYYPRAVVQDQGEKDKHLNEEVPLEKPGFQDYLELPVNCAAGEKLVFRQMARIWPHFFPAHVV
ncbi:MAG: hypothetical protein OEW33_16005, partial [Nitrospirota bacterium]|nr:hypothetical protein [Nitrospirota bacterium]